MFKKIISIIFILVIFNCSVSVSALSAKSAVVYDPITKSVLYGLNLHEKMSMASTTKLMTALIAVEHIEKYGDKIVEITQEMVAVEGSSMGLQKGDKIKLSSLLVGLLLPSGNDAANSIALAVCESFESFAKLMNDKAQQIGMKNSFFVTPSGLDAPNHQSTAYDMALLMAECMKKEEIEKITGSTILQVNYYSSLKQNDITVTFENHNKLLSYYEYCTGGKTGYTKQSGRCLVSSASKNSYPLIAVTFNASDDWNDHVWLYDMEYSNMQEVNFEQAEYKLYFAEGGFTNINVESKTMYKNEDDKLERKVFLPRFIYNTSYEIGETIGYVRYYLNDNLIIENKIIKE